MVNQILETFFQLLSEPNDFLEVIAKINLSNFVFRKSRILRCNHERTKEKSLANCQCKILFYLKSCETNVKVIVWCTDYGLTKANFAAQIQIPIPNSVWMWISKRAYILFLVLIVWSKIPPNLAAQFVCTCPYFEISMKKASLGVCSPWFDECHKTPLDCQGTVWH